MEFVENETRPKSVQKLLIKQVEEKSGICDVTVKADNWEKRFHRCVLIQSPFFECVFRHEYKETHTGKVEIKLGTPTTIEMAIMFLYGQIPKLTLDNVEIMMALAEYFFIPELKSECVAWLNAIKVNEDNCIKLIEICTLFDVKLYKCIEFAEGRLDCLFENERFTRIDSDSVNYIFTERGFTYISMDAKLKFLVKWTNFDPVNRLGSAKDLVKLLDFRENSREILKQFVNDQIFRDITEDKVSAEILTEDENSKHEVIIMYNVDCSKKSFWCLDLIREKWFKLEINSYCKLNSSFHILGVQNSDCTVYFLECSTFEKKIVCLDLETFLLTSFPVFQTGGLSRDKVRMYGDVCIITENTSLKVNKQIKEKGANLGRQSRFGFNSKFCYEESVRIKTININTSTVYIGKVVNDRIKTKPLFTFLNGKVSKMCLNKLYSVAFIFEEGTRIIIYDINDCTMKVIEEPKIDVKSDEICYAKNGFVIFNNNRCIYLLKQEVPGFETKIIEFLFSEVNVISCCKLYFVNERWYRYFRNRSEGIYHFEWASHDELQAAENTKDVNWKPLPLPLDAKCRIYTFNRQIFHIRLPKSKLRCAIECRHCDYLNNSKRGSKSFSLYMSNIYNDEDYLYEGNYDYSDTDDYTKDWYD